MRMKRTNFLATTAFAAMTVLGAGIAAAETLIVASPQVPEGFDGRPHPPTAPLSLSHSSRCHEKPPAIRCGNRVSGVAAV